VDERSYLRVANTLNAYGIWTSWCSQFLTEAGFKTLGMAHLERSLRAAGWRGTTLTLHHDVDPGGGYGYGNVLIDEAMLGEKTAKWLKAVRDHAEEHHHSYLVGGKRTFCVPAVVAR
jgi:hypothetical protein